MSVVHDEAEHKQGLGDDHRHLELEKYALESILEVSSVTNVTLCAVAKHAVRVDGTMETHNHPATSADRIRWGPGLCPYSPEFGFAHMGCAFTAYIVWQSLHPMRLSKAYLHGGMEDCLFESHRQVGMMLT